MATNRYLNNMRDELLTYGVTFEIHEPNENGFITVAFKRGECGFATGAADEQGILGKLEVVCHTCWLLSQ
jgi:hypothetical protein